MTGPAARPVPRARPGFSLVEVTVVAMIMGIMAVMVVPALESAGEVRGAGAAAEVQRRLETARARALATGRPCGVRIDVQAGTLEALALSSPGAAPVAATGPDGMPEPACGIASLFPGVRLVGFSGGDEVAGRGTIWFGHDGTPHSRDGAGARAGPWTGDALVRLTGGHVVRVARLSGAVTR